MTVPLDGTLPQTTSSYRLSSLLSPGSAAQEARGRQSQRDPRLGPPAQEPQVPLPAGESRAALKCGEGREVSGLGGEGPPLDSGCTSGEVLSWVLEVNGGRPPTLLSLAAELLFP